MLTCSHEITSFLLNARQGVEESLDRLIPDMPKPHRKLFQAARYSLLGAGKRLRPILVLATTKVMQGDLKAALEPASALEMVHTYSLIHDDLPAMDNDDFRRGKPTLHKVYPESHAILAGDFLLTYAFEVISQAPLLSSDQKIALVQLLARGAGGEGMIGGQIMDLEAEGILIGCEELQNIHLCKTASLIQTAMAFGGVISNGTDRQIKILQQFGSKLGLAFQIIDDILDVTCGYGSDKSNNKTTYATLFGVEKARSMAEELHRSALSHLEELSLDTTLLMELAESMIKRKL